MGRPRTGEHERNVDEVIALILKGEDSPERVVEVVRVNGGPVTTIKSAKRWIEIAKGELQVRRLRESVGRVHRGRALGAANVASSILKERLHAPAT